MKKKIEVSGDLKEKIGLMFVLIIEIAIFSFMNGNYFSAANAKNILVSSSLTGLVAIAETYQIIATSIDMSTGSVAAFSGVFAAMLLNKGMNPVATLLFALVAGGIVGVINGVFVTKLKIEPFITTLATMEIIRGFAYIICDGKAVYISDDFFINLGSYQILGFLSIPVLVLIISFIIFGIVLKRTCLGRSVYVLGGNKYAARLAGLKPNTIILKMFIISGVLSALGGVFLAARMNSGQPSACDNLAFDGVTAAVLGGTAFSGGVGTMLGTVIGVFIIQCFNTGLTMMNVQIFWQDVAQGVLLILALSFDYFRKQRRNKKLILASENSK
ncbi:MAG TPA: ABC transporter permease [Ruminococcaceae bacterium]|mgnify:CR=1 FL=1|jgi:ribose transport system permease protein|nr:ABC transporter permease [Oscillospiraceae bacterium]